MYFAGTRLSTATTKSRAWTDHYMNPLSRIKLLMYFSYQVAIGLWLRGRKIFLTSGFLLAVACFSQLTILVESGRGMNLSQMTSTDRALLDALEGALKRINELRKNDRSTDIDCTAFFDDFNRYKEIESYISFFESIGIRAASADLNGNHYVYFELNYPKLTEMGLNAFFRNDTLTIVFTTASKSSVQISSFKSRLLSSGYL
jgi:hypothetical protein